MAGPLKFMPPADFYYVTESSMVMQCLLPDLTFKSGLVFSTLWKRITEAEKAAAAGKPVPGKAGKSTRKKMTKPAGPAKSAKKSIKKPVNKITKNTAGRKR